MTINTDSVSTLAKWTAIWAVITVYGFFCMWKGYSYASTKYEKEITSIKLAQQKALGDAQASARAEEEENAKKVSEALAARDKALSDAANLRSAAVRVRTQSDTVSKDLKRAGDADATASNSYRKRLGQCEKLLGESAGLLGEGVELSAEGAGLSAKLSGDKDTLTADLK
jgi:hypothetical protein